MTRNTDADSLESSASDSLDDIVAELVRHSSSIDRRAAAEMTARIAAATRLFVCAAGRSGIISRAFANRLTQMGFDVHCVGDGTTPAITVDDTLLVISTSGTTGGPLAAARTAHSLGSEILTVTGAPDSPLAQLSSAVIIIPNPSSPRQPLNSLAEQLVLLTLESIIIDLMAACRITEDEMRARHANLE